MYFAASFCWFATTTASLHSFGRDHTLICFDFEAESRSSWSGTNSSRVISDSNDLLTSELVFSYRLTFLQRHSRKWWSHQRCQSLFQLFWLTKWQLWFSLFRRELRLTLLIFPFQVYRDQKHWFIHFQSWRKRDSFCWDQDASFWLILLCCFWGCLSVLAFRPLLSYIYMRNIED